MEIFDLSDTCCLLLTSCSGKAAEETAGQEVQKAGKNTEAASKEDDAAEKETQEPEPEILHFVDVYQNPYQVEINPNVEKHDYKDDSFVHNATGFLMRATAIILTGWVWTSPSIRAMWTGRH